MPLAGITPPPVVRPLRGTQADPDRRPADRSIGTRTVGPSSTGQRRRSAGDSQRRTGRVRRRVQRRLLAGAAVGGAALVLAVPAVRAAALPSTAPAPAPTFPAPCSPGVGGPGGCLPGPTPSLPGLPPPRPTLTTPPTAGGPTAPSGPTGPGTTSSPTAGSGPSTAAPTPTPVVPPEVDQPGGVSGWIARGISAAISGFFRGLVVSALTPLLNLLGRTLLTTPTPDQLPRVGELWESGRQFTIAAYVLLVIIAGITVMVHETAQTRYGIKEIAPRVVIGFLAANLSLLVCGQAIRFANAASAAALGDGIDPNSAATTLSTLIASPLAGTDGLFLILLGLVLGGMLVALLVGYVVRVALTVCLVVAAAPAVACYGTPWTEGVARWWGRAFLGVLAIEVVQSVALVSAVRVFFAPGGWTAFGPNADGLVNLIVALALVYILIKIPFWVLHQVRAGGGRSFVGSLVRGFIAYKAFGLMRGRGARPGRSGRTPSGTGGSAYGLAGPGPGRPGPGGGAAGAGTRPRPRPAGGGGGGASRGGGGAGGPYARVLADADGQTRLPLGRLRRGRLPAYGPPPSASGSTAASPSTRASSARRRAVRGRQLRLPLDGQWPEDRPVLQADGQYRLPITVTRVRRPRPAAGRAGGTGGAGRPAPPARTPAAARAAGRQLGPPLDPYAGLRPERRGQYRIPFDGIRRTPRAPASPPTASPTTASPPTASTGGRAVPVSRASAASSRPDAAALARKAQPGSPPRVAVGRSPRPPAGQQLAVPPDPLGSPARGGPPPVRAETRTASRPPGSAPLPRTPAPGGTARPAGPPPLRTAAPHPRDGGDRR